MARDRRGEGGEAGGGAADERPGPVNGAQNGVSRSAAQQQHGEDGGGNASATVHFLDGDVRTFNIDRNATGKVLFDRVAKQVNLIEKDYFALSFRGSDGSRNWIYPDNGSTDS